MKNFGKLKSKLIKKLSDSYNDGTLKPNIKLYFNPIMENETIKDLYIFYDEFENKTISNVVTAKEYVNEIASTLKGKHNEINNFVNNLDKKMGDVLDVENNEIYEHLDTLLYGDRLGNLGEKLQAKSKLVEHLIKPKKTDIDLVENYSTNERLLYAVMVNSFNEKFSTNLTEEEKQELKVILNLNKNELKIKINELKENVLTKIDKLLSESNNNDLEIKLTDVINEVNQMDYTKFNYYKLNRLQSDII